MRFAALRRGKPFRLFVSSDAPDKPPDRWFRSLKAALRAFNALRDEWRGSAWIIEYRDQPTIGGIPLVRNVVYVEHGRRVKDRAQ